mmetsp:Transcript_56592/g.99457  ORF Transcript_56592/g.99457 Transcript_56592/m.99457 type:complete len:242 (+) Transcript_56592:1108-1833(+)
MLCRRRSHPSKPHKTTVKQSNMRANKRAPCKERKSTRRWSRRRWRNCAWSERHARRIVRSVVRLRLLVWCDLRVILFSRHGMQVLPQPVLAATLVKHRLLRVLAMCLLVTPVSVGWCRQQHWKVHDGRRCGGNKLLWVAVVERMMPAPTETAEVSKTRPDDAPLAKMLTATITCVNSKSTAIVRPPKIVVARRWLNKSSRQKTTVCGPRRESATRLGQTLKPGRTHAFAMSLVPRRRYRLV